MRRCLHAAMFAARPSDLGLECWSRSPPTTVAGEMTVKLHPCCTLPGYTEHECIALKYIQNLLQAATSVAVYSWEHCKTRLGVFHCKAVKFIRDLHQRRLWATGVRQKNRGICRGFQETTSMQLLAHGLPSDSEVHGVETKNEMRWG